MLVTGVQNEAREEALRARETQLEVDIAAMRADCRLAATASEAAARITQQKRDLVERESEVKARAAALDAREAAVDKRLEEAAGMLAEVRVAWDLPSAVRPKNDVFVRYITLSIVWVFGVSEVNAALLDAHDAAVAERLEQAAGMPAEVLLFCTSHSRYGGSY